MECTANNVDQKDCLTFVSSVPNVVRQFAVPDDNRLILGIAQPSVKAAGVRLLREAGATQSERPFEQSTTGYLLPEDGRHLVNVDAHSAEARHSRSISPTINESVIAGECMVCGLFQECCTIIFVVLYKSLSMDNYHSCGRPQDVGDSPRYFPLHVSLRYDVICLFC